MPSAGIYYDSFTTFTATYDHVRLTSTLGNDYPLMTPAPSVLQQLLTDRTPLTAVNPVMNTSDLLVGVLYPSQLRCTRAQSTRTCMLTLR